MTEEKKCRYCQYFKYGPHKVIEEYSGETKEYDGLCIGQQIFEKYGVSLVNFTSSCYLFRPKDKYEDMHPMDKD